MPLEGYIIIPLGKKSKPFLLGGRPGVGVATHFQTFRRTITKIVGGWEAKGGMGEGSLLTLSTLAQHCQATICISASLSQRKTLL